MMATETLAVRRRRLPRHPRNLARYAWCAIRGHKPKTYRREWDGGYAEVTLCNCGHTGSAIHKTKEARHDA